MKNVLPGILALMFLQPSLKQEVYTQGVTCKKSADNLFIITIDGFRWQEVFAGADSILINNENYTPDTSTLKLMYWSSTAEARRKQLMPFLWNVVKAKGQLYGNRELNNKMNVANAYSISYPGYNEMFTGNTDLSISSNKKYKNPNINVLEYLNALPAYNQKVAVFTSWDVFPYILNEERSGLFINSGYKNVAGHELLNKVQDDAVIDKKATRHDQLTFVAAKEYINKKRPKVLYLGLGETDEFAHDGRYDLYLEKANQADKMIADLWHLVQTTPGYKDNTTFIITTDHGRGSRSSKWTSHGEFIRGSSQTWFAVIGPGISALGEMQEEQQLYQQQLAQTIAQLLGENFNASSIAPSISLR